jgi:hypothetical protein
MFNIEDEVHQRLQPAHHTSGRGCRQVITLIIIMLPIKP